MIGKTIGQYRIVGQLGRGGMGTVYRAIDETLDREVAIKILNPELADTEILTRFRAEATILAKLNHPAIATIYELFRSDTDLLMVMEFVRGQTLEKVCDRRGGLPPEQAAYLIDKILSALAHAHRAGIVHSDMKPANVMVTEHGGVKIMDFGIARVRGTDHARTDGFTMGTPAYMPPEQVLGHQLDGRADLYSIGVMLYRLLTGALPFRAETGTGVLRQQISEPPAPLPVDREDLPEWCSRIVDRALAKSPDDRFQTAEEFREALGRATGLVTAELTRAFAVFLADIQMTTPKRPGTLEGFDPTSSPAFQRTEVLGPAPSVSRADSLAATGRAPVSKVAERFPRNVIGAFVGLHHNHRALSSLMLSTIVGGVALLAIVTLRRPSLASMTTTLRGVAAASPTVPSTTGRPVSVEPAPSSPPHPEPRAARTSVAPIAFDARTLVDAGDGRRERKSKVVLGDSAIYVRATDDHELLQAVPYRDVTSISYSRGRDPLWNGPAGPAMVARVRRFDFGIFAGERHWVSLRTTNRRPRFLVLRLNDGAQASRAIGALEERIGRKAVRVADRTTRSER